MIRGVGTDLVPVARIARAVERHGERFLRRVFTPAECRGPGGILPAESLAARFAAKEAVLKALGTGWASGARWTDVEVVGGRGRPPAARLHGVAHQRALALGVRRVHLSLAHDAGLALAFAVLEGEEADAGPGVQGSGA
ncbi:holo-ACP synthase [Deferrisoma camini]|uniref:holo-ACP synthase n=1 Tax=Deferrisoma camini TaxID=1035120 RepID=UPI00046CE89C|nr:holo-ACP synthase [Deferrisoma camini]